MTINDIYVYCFRNLERMYFKDTEKYDNLGIILGQMSPELFKNSKSADPAFYGDFKNEIKGIAGGKENYSFLDGLSTMKVILQQYNNKYGYELSNVLNDIDIFFDV